VFTETCQKYRFPVDKSFRPTGTVYGCDAEGSQGCDESLKTVAYHPPAPSSELPASIIDSGYQYDLNAFLRAATTISMGKSLVDFENWSTLPVRLLTPGGRLLDRFVTGSEALYQGFAEKDWYHASETAGAFLFGERAGETLSPLLGDFGKSVGAIAGEYAKYLLSVYDADNSN